jgi:hypothetical protein
MPAVLQTGPLWGYIYCIVTRIPGLSLGYQCPNWPRSVGPRSVPGHSCPVKQLLTPPTSKVKLQWSMCIEYASLYHIFTLAFMFIECVSSIKNLNMQQTSCTQAGMCISSGMEACHIQSRVYVLQLINTHERCYGSFFFYRQASWRLLEVPRWFGTNNTIYCLLAFS